MNRGVVSAGRLYADLIFSDLPSLPRLGTETFAGRLGLHAGGGAFITAAYVAARGRPAALMATLPAPPFESVVIAEIRQAGVDPSPSAPAPRGIDPQITAAMAYGGDRAFLTRRAGPAIPAEGIQQLSQLEWRHLHIGELSTLVEHPELLTAARTAGLTVSLDCGWDETQFRRGVVELIAAVDVFLPNQEEVDALRRAGLSEPFAPITVTKCGAEGAKYRSNAIRCQVPAEAAAVIDTTGAGDAFNGGFLDAWLEGANPEDCLRAGTAAGAIAVSSPGGIGGLLAGAQPGRACAPLM